MISFSLKHDSTFTEIGRHSKFFGRWMPRKFPWPTRWLHYYSNLSCDKLTPITLWRNKNLIVTIRFKLNLLFEFALWRKFHIVCTVPSCSTKKHSQHNLRNGQVNCMYLINSERVHLKSLWNLPKLIATLMKGYT